MLAFNFMIGSVFLVTFLLLGLNIAAAIIVTMTVAMIVVDLMALMFFWKISLNAISLVNLVMVCRKQQNVMYFTLVFTLECSLIYAILFILIII